MVSESLTLRAIRAEQYPSLKSTSKRPGCDGTYASIADMERQFFFQDSKLADKLDLERLWDSYGRSRTMSRDTKE